jgi:putative ABC transport system permease protein
MFYVGYMLSELRRRKGRTLLTALGLGVGVGLVVTVSALSHGLDRAQDKVLKPLTGVGTDMSVTRPIRITSSGGGPPSLSAKERQELQSENGGTRLGLRNLGKAGTKFSRTSFNTTQLSFPASQVATTKGMAGVKEASGGLTLSAIDVSGKVPKQTAGQQGGGGFGPPGGGAPGAGATGQPGGPRSINFNQFTVSGIDTSQSSLAAISPSQLTKGAWFGSDATSREAVLNVSYAKRKGLGVGDTFKIKGKAYEVVGIAQTPIGGSASDVYIRLGQLQQLSGRKGRINVMYVRADSTDDVARVAAGIKRSLDQASVTTSQDLADRVGGSLVDAKNLSGKLGTALEIAGLAAAFLIAALLTLSSVTKRIRELGTLKALGWRQHLVVRQVTGESLLQGLLGGVAGAVIGIAGAAIITASGPTLKASVAGAATGGGGPPGFGRFGGFGQGAVQAGSSLVKLTAPVDAGLIVLAIALALVGGLLSGAIGGMRAARLRPADALRHID